MPQTTANYSTQDIANAAYAAGFRGTELAIAVAISKAEDTSGDPNATSKDGYYSVGPWQFIASTWTAITKGEPLGNRANLQDSANAAYALKKASGWGQWATYTNGAYLQYMPEATAAAAIATKNGGKGTALASTPTTATPAFNPLDPGSWVKSAVSSIFKPLVEFMIEAGMIFGGLVMILFGGRLLYTGWGS